MNCFSIIAIAIVLSGCGEDGSYFSLNTKQINADAVSRMEAEGVDLRIYEFTPRTDSKKQCVFVSGTQKAGLQCWDKK